MSENSTAESWTFVLGPHRSGTTIVARVLATSGKFVYLTAADIVEFHGGRGRDALRRLEQSEDTRRIDDVRIAADLPEEYGFLLRGRRLTETTAPRILSVHRDLARRRGGAARYLLKNPWDVAGAVRIDALFPGARFVFVVRDPVPTIDSQVRALRTLFAEPSEYHALLDLQYRRLQRRRLLFALLRFRYSRGGLVDRLLRSFVERTDGLIESLDRLPGERWIVTRQEDLVAGPQEEIARLYAFLGLPPAGIDAPAAEIRPVDRPPGPHVAARAAKIREETRRYRETFGY